MMINFDGSKFQPKFRSNLVGSLMVLCRSTDYRSPSVPPAGVYAIIPFCMQTGSLVTNFVQTDI